MFVGLEVLSLPLYLLCALARRRRLLSQEAAVKYFLLGAFSSAFFLYGIALLYGYAGSVSLPKIATAVSAGAGSDGLLLMGTALLGVGLLFKIGAVPFHGWKPDVYQGAPTPVTALMSSCTVVSAFGALLRVFYVAFGHLTWDWRPAMWAIAILTMIAGAIIAITQTDVKRLLAYSSIAHAGFILTALVAASVGGLGGALFYLAAYGLTTVGAFAVITLVRDPGGEAGHLSRWAGLGKRSPTLAGVFAFFLLAFAGIPLTSGFQLWNGTAPILNSRPTPVSAIPAKSSVVLPLLPAAVAAILVSDTEPEYPYSIAMPNRKNAEEKAPSRKYFIAASCDSSRRRRASPHSRYSGSDSTSSATNIVSRSLEAGTSNMPPMANMASG
jgi:NADH-quinone oxidoreductase subunit N